VEDYRTFPGGFFYRVRVELKDESVLHAREFQLHEVRNYSFHWQKADGELICRWDDAPHYPDLETFPFHKHEGKKILPSLPMNLDTVLEIVNSRLPSSSS
jgi:hypothetical protein